MASSGISAGTDGENKRKAKSTYDIQRIKLEKLMKDPEKLVHIPERPKDKKMREPPEFIRNAWGSSAGAGSGDFHVYRGVRRREYARQKFLDEKLTKDTAETRYHAKVEENQRQAEETTSKKRAKRLKKKEKQKNAKKAKKLDNSGGESDGEDTGAKTKEGDNSGAKAKEKKNDSGAQVNEEDSEDKGSAPTDKT